MDREALGRLTYTQWEAWLASASTRTASETNLVIVAPADGWSRPEVRANGRLARCRKLSICAVSRRSTSIPVRHSPSADDLAAHVFASAVLDALR